MPRWKDLIVLSISPMGHHRASLRLVVLASLVSSVMLLTSCANTSTDETLGWSEAKLYTEARDKMNESDFDKCGNYFEKLEARFPFGPYSNKRKLIPRIAFGKPKSLLKP